jgi:hypothetical protein
MRLATVHSRRGRRIALFAGAVLVAVAATTCRMVTDNVVRPLEQPLQAGGCMHDCAKAAVERIHAENDLHHDNVKACNGDAQCLAQEETRHEAAQAAIDAFRKQCQQECHHQGGGRGGR